MLFTLAAGSLTACAQAHREGLATGRPDGSITLTDSPNGGQQDSGSGGGQMDAPQHLDSPTGGGTQTLTQTTANDDTGVGLACPGAGNWTVKDSYYRIFTLSDYGVTGTFHVTGVDFVVSAAAQSPSLRIGIGTYSGTTGQNTISTNSITLTQTTTFTPPNTTTAVPVHVPITADITGNLIVEIDQTVAGSSGTPYMFYPGANEEGESKPSYVYAAGSCGISAPTSMDYEAQSLSTPTHSNMVLTVTGST